eukprot:COSAG02_NODE_2753_length_8093_cov_4.161746_6_plen_65_part_00
MGLSGALWADVGSDADQRAIGAAGGQARPRPGSRDVWELRAEQLRDLPGGLVEAGRARLRALLL